MSIFTRFTNLLRGEKLSEDINRELSFHIRERAEELMEGGMSEKAAIEEARRQFGNPTFQAEATRDNDVIGWLDSVMGDVRYAARALLRSPVFASVAIASLALGIGANTAIYTLIDAVIVRTLPAPRPQELVQVLFSDEGDDAYWTFPIYEQVRERMRGIFTHSAAFAGPSFNVSNGGEVRNLRGQWAGGDYFALFGMQPAAGRLFTAADDVRGCPGTAVLSHGFWQSEYGGRPDAVGQSLSITGKPFQIIGVVAPGNPGPEVGNDIQVYVPLCASEILRGPGSLDARSRWFLRVVGRRDETLTLAQVRARLKTIAPDVYAATLPASFATADDRKEYLERSFGAREVATGMSDVRDRYARALKILMGGVALVLLIACANVANLLLARAAARQREVAIRMAIGAGRRRLVRQLLTESVLLAALGAAGGLFVAHWGTRGLVALISSSASPVVLDLGFSARVLGFTVLAATITVVLFGLVPAWRGTRVDPQTTMRAAGRGVAEGGGSGGRFTLGKALVAAQVALSLTLLVGAGLLLGTLRNLVTLDPGFRAEGVLVAHVNYQRAGIPMPQRAEAHRSLLERVRAIPGVRSAGASEIVPLGRSSWNDAIFVEGFTAKSREDQFVWFNEVSDSYFTTMGMRLLAGRDFNASDAPGAARVAIVSQSVADKFFGGDAIGKTYRLKRNDTFEAPVTIVGVVMDAKYQQLREKESGTVYLAQSQLAERSPMISMEVRAADTASAAALAGPVKAAIAGLHPLATVELRTLSDQVAGTLRRERMLALLSALFSAVALGLSMLGLYGVMAYSVARRRNEIGVRIALGAASARVVRMVLGDVARVVAIGAALGIAGALAAGKLVTSFLYGMEPSDPLVLGAATAVLLIVALAAGFIPALRASRVDPVAALRED